MIKNVYLLVIILFFITACQQNEVIKTHGIAYLDKREKLIIVNKSNKNDTVNILGQPSTRGMTNDNLWIYIERTITRGKLLKFGRNYIKKKEFYDKEKMNEINFAKNITKNEVRRENFIYSFLSSVRQKMLTKRK